jgi:hypothetical protein
MKYFIAFLFCIPQLLSAQNIPNPGFEIWYIGDVVLKAGDWENSNFYTFNQFGFYSANPDWEDFTEGFTSIRLSTFQQDTLAPFVAFTISGLPIMDYATGEVDVISGGTPFPYRPSKMMGKYQFASESPIEDFGQARVILKKYNTATGQADTIGYGENVLLNPTVGFQSFEVSIQYLVPDVTPDSIVVIFYSTNPEAPNVGGELWVDDLSFDFSTSIFDVENMIAISIFPNPFQEIIKVEIEALEKGQIELIDINGKIVFSKLLEKGSQTIKIETSNLVSGNYFINWRNEKGECQILEKVVKIK